MQDTLLVTEFVTAPDIDSWWWRRGGEEEEEDQEECSALRSGRGGVLLITTRLEVSVFRP